MSAVSKIVERSENGQATRRDGYILLDAMQREMDRLQEMIDQIDANHSAHDPRVIIRVDDNPKRFRFENIDWFAEWLAKGWAE